MAYQREAYAVLARAFGVMREPTASIEVPPATACNLVTECRRTFGTLAARELWPRLGLPVVPSMLTALPETVQGSLFSNPEGR